MSGAIALGPGFCRRGCRFHHFDQEHLDEMQAVVVHRETSAAIIASRILGVTYSEPFATCHLDGERLERTGGDQRPELVWRRHRVILGILDILPRQSYTFGTVANNVGSRDRHMVATLAWRAGSVAAAILQRLAEANPGIAAIQSHCPMSACFDAVHVQSDSFPGTAGPEADVEFQDSRPQLIPENCGDKTAHDVD